MYTDNFLSQKLHEAKGLLERVPTIRDMDLLESFPHSTTYRDHFGSWNKALTIAGLSINNRQGIPSVVRVLSEVEASYIAGILDGEGCIRIEKRRIRCNISNTCKELLVWIQKVVNGGYLFEVDQGKYQLQWRVNFRKNEALDLLPQLLPYLIVKKKVVEEVLEFVRT